MSESSLYHSALFLGNTKEEMISSILRKGDTLKSTGLSCTLVHKPGVPSQPPPQSPEWPGKHTILTQQWEISPIPYKTGSAPPSSLPVSFSLLSKTHKSPREGASPSFCKVPLISALNRANHCSLPQGLFAIKWFSTQRGNTMPRGDGKAHPTQRDSGSCQSCLSVR